MSPKRGRRIDELFARALRIDPAQREAWLRRGCGDDEELQAEVARLLDQDEGTVRDWFLTAPGPPGRALDPTESWPAPGGPHPPRGPEPIDHVGAGSVAGASGFSPRAAIAACPRPHPISESESVVRARLRELPMIYIPLLVMTTFWRCTILGDGDRVLHYLDGTVIVSLGGVIALLSSRWPISLARLRALELGMIGMLASRVAIVEYRLVILFSLRGNPMMAQLTVKNIVLLTTVLILTYGLYVPKTWRRAALVVGPLAPLPFATLWVLYLRHPGRWAGLGAGGRRVRPPGSCCSASMR